ncbi:MAG TPA: sulfite exporter TauE/SafE family protein [Pyrinomonadaceae bacterium]|nr:sulfite exporter TauE/SafE family protein [Acidobacteriota bacterium]HQZ97972.1 sulfite exporter TauE/SafE family protein [Pyrinomonadaceae bacterium]
MSALFIIGLILSAVIGLSLGLIGGGGSILTVPILVYLLGVGPHEAVGMSLAVVGATSILGSYLHWRRDNVDLSSGLLFGLSGIVGAFIGSPLTKLVSAEVLLLIFGLLMFVVAISMIWRRNHAISDKPHKAHPFQGIFAGLGVGVLTGFLGVGGGFLIVPALVFFGGLDMKKAIGTSLFVIFLNCAAGLIGHMSQSVFDWTITIEVMALAVGGAFVGTMLSHRIPAARLQSMFAVLVLGVAAFLVVKNYSVIF